ncbi:MAG TPA: hypothetical protein VGW40_13335 [Allosphingosinicella sp.]|nr:hypothetical protein [Allosphingosinicella sp.]
MTPEFSEFSYGFAITNEFVGWTELRAAPVFPTLIEEGKEGGGYDVKLEMPAAPLYLQFKRAQHMTRRSAREISQHNLPLHVPFHRFGITERSRSFQHTSLVERDDGHSFVFYVGPRFHELGELDDAFTRQEVVRRSIFVSPTEIGLIDDDDAHSVAYDNRRAYFCSEPRQITPVSIEGLKERLLGRLAANPRPLREQLPEWRERAQAARMRAVETDRKLELIRAERKAAMRAAKGQPPEIIVTLSWLG